MLNVLGVTAPVFLLIGLGYVAVRAGWLGEGTRALGDFVLRLAMPALIFRALASRPLAEVVDVGLLASYAGASLIAFFATYALYARQGGARAACRALGGAAPNSGFVGFPLAILLVGPKASVALALCLVVENALTIPLGLALAERGRPGPPPFARLLRNPLVIAIVVGLVAAATSLALPAPLARVVDLLANAAPGAALVAIGGGLAGLSLAAGVIEIVPVAAAKLLLHPFALMGLSALVTGADPEVRRAMLVMASAPAFSIYPLICRAFGEERAASTILLAETALAFPTMSAWALVA